MLADQARADAAEGHEHDARDHATRRCDLLAKRGYDPAIRRAAAAPDHHEPDRRSAVGGPASGRFLVNDHVVVDVQDDLLRMRTRRDIEETQPEEALA